MTDDVIKKLVARRHELAVWQPSADFITKIEELAGLVESKNLFTDPAAGFLLDAIPIAEFTKFRPTEGVRLCDQKEQWPDGQIGTSRWPINVEVTEVLEEGRRRGDEYRHHGQAPVDKAEDWRRRAEAIPGRLEQGIIRKIDKGYSKDCILLVYLNMSTYGVLQKETEAAIAHIKGKYANDFREICVLWQGKLL